jgi:hypothetical protein
MYRPRVVNEVAARPWMTEKELRRQQVRLEPVARRTRHDDVARRVRAALRERMDMVERGARVVERRGAVHTAAPAVSQRRELDRSLVLVRREPPNPTQETSWRARCAGKRDAMTVSSGQSHLAGKDDTPRRESSLTRGVVQRGRRGTGGGSTCDALAALASPTASCTGLWCSFASGCVGRESGMVPRCPISAVSVPFAQEAETAASHCSVRRAPLLVGGPTIRTPSHRIS